MRELSDRIMQSLAGEEARAERFANNVRFILIFILTITAIVNAPSVSFEANILNFSAIIFGYAYGFAVLFRIKKTGYHPAMKYITSCLDVILVFFLLAMYARITVPSVALKNYVFLIIFPLIALTAFRYDRILTLVAGGLAVTLYTGLIFILYLTKSITITAGGYDQELFSGDVTFIGQLTKILFLIGYILLLAYLAKYSRNLFAKLITDELNSRQQKELIDWEMKIASEVQKKLIPQSFPAISGLNVYATVRQGRYVGGDYCDFIKLNENNVLLIVADVSGKGVPAALIMAEVHASVQLLSSMDIDLEKMAQRLNTLIFQSTSKRDFVTFFICAIDTLRGSLVYVNAGHPPPMLYAGGNVRPLSERTIPLGCRSSLPNVHLNTEAFPPGSVIVAYTDGLIEQSDKNDELYGDERLRIFIQNNAGIDVEEIVTKLLDEVGIFGHGQEYHDDIGIAAAKSYKIQNI